MYRLLPCRLGPTVTDIMVMVAYRSYSMFSSVYISKISNPTLSLMQNGSTALHLACKGHFLETAKALLVGGMTSQDAELTDDEVRRTRFLTNLARIQYILVYPVSAVVTPPSLSYCTVRSL